jgi:pilus assembly protein CpaD
MRNFAKATLIVLGLSVSACGGTSNRGLESVHQPVVTRTNYVFDAAKAGDDLSLGEAARVRGWFDSLQLGYGDHVSIDNPDGDGSAARSAVAALAARYGLLVDDNAPLTAGAIPPGNVRVVVSRTKATVPGCPDWSRKPQAEFGGNSSSNLGCATNSNLAAMIANPADLVKGQDAGAVFDAASATKAANVFRTRKPSGQADLKTESSGAR